MKKLRFSDRLQMGFLTMYQCKKFGLILVAFSVSFSRLLFTLFTFIASPLFRFQGSGNSLKNNSDLAEGISGGNFKEEFKLEPQSDEEEEYNDVGDSLDYVERKKETSFTFKFPTFDEFIRIQKEKGELFASDFVHSTNENLEGKSMSGDSDCSVIESEEKEDDKHVDVNSVEVLFDEDKTEDSVLADFKEDTEELVEKDHDFICNPDSLENDKIDSHCKGFLSDGDFVGDSDEDVSKTDQGKVSNSLKIDFLSEKDFHEDNVSIGDSEKHTSKGSSNFDDANKLESLWEHQDLIEQLQMELKKVRATGLPTIMEESESPKITEDLKPWKIDEKFQHEECMDELHKFYKSYTERMRKLDIFNYQKMYAIGFLGLKDPLQSMSSQRSSGQLFKSLLPENIMQFRQNKVNESDPMEKFIKEIQSDLEVVYVGHMCLSWELLRWQYGKALDLWDSDPRGIHHYNEVAGEFQQFQVLMQRFVEDEPFQGPRVQYYIKTRCVNRNLLQVPLIREDSSGNRRNRRNSERSENVITSDQLVEIIEESIRILWRFIRADKDTSSLISKDHKVSPLQLQDPGDLELLRECRNVLQKKEKKLKELRSGSGILGRLWSRREEDSDQVLFNFFSQVDMKLVCRVLNMSKITSEQLAWCHSKLSRIYMEHRRIHVDPSFLPFPC